MKPTLRLFIRILLLLVLPFVVFAKGDTIRIVITGATLFTPIEISDPALIHRFNVSSGPGTGPTVNPEGLNVDWSQGLPSPGRSRKIHCLVRNNAFKSGHVCSRLRGRSYY